MKQHNIDSISRKEIVLYSLFGIFIASLLISNITASKLFSFTFLFGYEITIPIGTSLFAITFIATDIIGEIWGRKHSILLVIIGLVARILAVFFFYIAIEIEPVPYWDNQVAYESILMGSGGILLAGILTYPISQLNDVFVFHYLKSKENNKLWVRNIASTFSSQFLDSFIFVLIAFAASLTIEQLISIIVGQVIVKWIIAIVDTPIVYIIRNFTLRKKLFDFSD